MRLRLPAPAPPQKWRLQRLRNTGIWTGDLVEEVLGPDDAVDGLAGRVPDGAAGEGLLVGFGLTLVALRHTLAIRRG